MAVNTTFSMMQQLLKDAVDASATLTDILKVALKARVDALPQFEPHAMTSSNVQASAGATIDEATNSIQWPIGPGGTIDYDSITFVTPVRIDGTIGAIGALVGHDGLGPNGPVATADITLQYRLTAAGAWLAFGQTVVVDETSFFQLRATIAAQIADADMPQLHIFAEQL